MDRDYYASDAQTTTIPLPQVLAQSIRVFDAQTGGKKVSSTQNAFVCNQAQVEMSNEVGKRLTLSNEEGVSSL